MNLKYLKLGFLVTILFGGTGLFSACSDDLELGKPVDESPYHNIYSNNAYLCDAKSNVPSTVVELFGETYETSIKLGLTKAPAATATAKITWNADYLARYNSEHHTDFEPYPRDLVSLASDGVFTVNAGNKFAEVKLTIRGGEKVLENKTYAIPLTLVKQTGEVALTEETKHCIYLVKDMRNAADCYKGEDAVKGFLFFEVNDVNPLNALSFQLENGKLLWDVVVLFAANINYNGTSGRPYVNCNPNVKYLLDNNEVYLQPLRKRGVKVLLGFLNNYDAASLTRLSDQAARDFAREVAEYCKAYNLDGVNYDDEYAGSSDPDNPAFVNPGGPKAAARLCYETKQAMPDKLVTVFQYGAMYGEDTVDGVDIDNWMDIVVPNYGSEATPLGNMTRRKCAGFAMEFARGYGNLDAGEARDLVTGGYGWFMGFAANPNSYPPTWNVLKGVETLYGSPLAPPSLYYKKNDPSPYYF